MREQEILKDIIELEAAYQIMLENGAKVQKLCHSIRKKVAGVSTPVKPSNISLDAKQIVQLKAQRRKNIVNNQVKSKSK